MKYIITFIVFGFVQMIFSQGQVEANDIAHENYYKSLKIKDSLIIELKRINKTDSSFIKNIEVSEKLWQSFVDEQFKLKFPEYKSWETRREIYGSQFDMVYHQFLKLYCDLRINTLYDLFEDN